jgi:hypothetical protein
MLKNAFFAIVILFAGLLSASCQTSSPAAANGSNDVRPNGTPVPVLVELFTSEGCDSCPPADRSLTFFEQQQPVSGARIIALEFHVDYWDSDKWKDPFSSASYSQRQNLYAQRFGPNQIYTPQMIVDGEKPFIGSDSNQATRTIAEAIKNPKANIQLTKKDGKLLVKIDSLPQLKDSTVFAAITEDNLTSDVRGGENSGSRLLHTAVVRSLQTIGSMAAGSKTFEGQGDLAVTTAYKSQDLKVVVFIQENESRRIYGVSEVPLAPSM